MESSITEKKQENKKIPVPPKKPQVRLIKGFIEKAQIAKGKNGHIPQMIQPIDYVERFNQLAERKAMSKAQTFRFLIDDYHKKNNSNNNE